MKRIMEKLETLLEWGGLKKEIILLVISGISLLLSLFHIPLPFSIAWVAIILCGVPIILEAIIGLVTAFDIKADVLVSLALVASICIGEHFAAGEIAFIMQLGALLEDLTVAKARAGIEKDKCRDCFARFYCSGGCAANAYHFQKDVKGSYEIGCELQRKRVECAIMIKAALAE